MVQHLPLTQVRNHLGAVVKRVHLNKEYVILEKDGIPLAGLMDIDEFADYLELQDPTARQEIRKSYQEYRAGKGRPLAEFLQELRQEEARKLKRRRSA
jgi:PHD/YefM family antitoxin component YafN of YafNO toxin-antitoxin module